MPIFVNGIRDPGFEACKAYVTAQNNMMSDFNAFKTYFTNYAHQHAFQNPVPPSRNVYSIGSGHCAGNGGGCGTNCGCGAIQRDKVAYHSMPPADEKLAACSVTICDYIEEEYSKLTAIQWYKLHLLRKKGNGSTQSAGVWQPALTISTVTNLTTVPTDITSEINDMKLRMAMPPATVAIRFSLDRTMPSAAKPDTALAKVSPLFGHFDNHLGHDNLT